MLLIYVGFQFEYYKLYAISNFISLNANFIVLISWYSKFIPKNSHFDTNSIHREIYERFQASYKGKEDIHTKLMRRYKDIHSWWFYLLLIVTLAVSLVLCTVLNDLVQLPWWGLLFAFAIAYSFTLPISIITATTNQVIGLTFAHFTLLCKKLISSLINYNILS